MLLRVLRRREVTNAIRFVLDDCLPPILRDRRWLVRLIARVYCGGSNSRFEVDFKRKVEGLGQKEVARFYEAAAGCGSDRVRATDLTDAERDWVIRNLEGASVLEIGAGAGYLSRAIASTGRRVVAVDLKPPAEREGGGVEWCLALADRLPFPNGAFDTVVAAHTLEHVVNFEATVAELRRVARRRLIVVVPRQRYYRYTVDYHLHFFPDREQLVLRMGMDWYRCEVVTGDLAYVAYLHSVDDADGRRKGAAALEVSMR